MINTPETGDPRPDPLAYLRHVDGLRAVAVALVVAYHAWPRSVPGGYVGVDVFFVISGYLITRLLLRELGAGTFSYRGFLLRRVRRLWPSFMVVAGAVLALGWLLLGPDALKDLARVAAASTIFASNWYFYATADYFNANLNTNLLLHTWSLAIEEQFYLVYPLALFVVRRSRVGVTAALGAVWAVSLGWATWAAFFGDAEGAFFATQLRVWELASGGLLALGPVARVAAAAMRRVASALRQKPRLARIASGAPAALGLIAIVTAAVVFSSATRVPGPALLLPVLGACLCIAGVDPDARGVPGRTLAARVLEHPAAVYVGLISYALYLWHWPVLTAIKVLVYDPEPLHMALGVVASAALASLTYHFVEQPIRRRVWLTVNWRLLGAAGVAAMTVLLVSAVTLKLDGAPGRIPAAALDALAAGPDPRMGERICTPIGDVARTYGGLPANVAPDVDASDSDGAEFTVCLIGDQSRRRIDFIVWGDSHASAIAGAAASQARAQGRLGLVAVRSACAPMLGVAWAELSPQAARDCAAYNGQVAGLIAAVRPTTTTLVARWNVYAPEPPNMFGGSHAEPLRSMDVDTSSGPLFVSAFEIGRAHV